MNFELYSGNIYRDKPIKVVFKDIGQYVKIAIANSIINHDAEIISADTGEIIAQFIDGLAIYIDSQYYYEIVNELRKLY